MAGWKFLLVVLTGFACPSWAKILIIEGSDQHAAYENLSDFVRAFSSVRQSFQQENSGTAGENPTVLAINGDYSGRSAWNLDRGQLAMDTLAQLSGEAQVVFNIGNHEGFDWGGREGITLFLSQAQDLISRLATPERPFRLTTANLTLTPVAAGLFRPFVDIASGPGKLVRFVGLTLPRFFEVSDYDRKAEPQLISAVEPLEKAARQQLELAAGTPGVVALVFLIHDDREEVAGLLERVLKWKAADPKLAHLQLPVAFAGHDHVHLEKSIGGTHLIDSQSNFAFSAVTLADDGGFLRNDFYSLERQRALKPIAKLSSRESALLSEIERALAQARAVNGTRVGTSTGFRESKLDLKAKRCELGTSLADGLGDWARAEAKAQRLRGWEDAFAMFNSSSYRREEPIPPGPLTRGVISSIFPFDGRPGLWLLTGQEIQSLFESLRTDRKIHHTYSPQLSQNLREGSDGKLSRNEKGQWKRLEPGKAYLLALDPWLGNNGYRIKSWEKILALASARKARLSLALSPAETFLEVLIHYWVPRLGAGREKSPEVVPAK